MQTPSNAIDALTKTIDSVSFAGLDNVTSTLNRLGSSVVDLSEVVGRVNGPQDVLDELHDGLDLFNRKLKELYSAVSNLGSTVGGLLNECNISSGLPDPFENVESAVKIFISVLNENLEKK